MLANSTAGLGSVFVAVGDTVPKAGGRLCLVLPKALLSGVAWGKTRELLRSKYQLEYIVASPRPASVELFREHQSQRGAGNRQEE